MNTLGSILLLLCLASFTLADDIPPALITVVGEGEVLVPPDYVTLTIGVKLQNTTAEQASDDVDKISADIIAFLKRNGVAEKDIQTSYVDVSPLYDYEESPPVQANFSAAKNVDFSLRDLSKYDLIVQGLFGVGANTVRYLDFKTNETETKMQIARSRASQNALEVAEDLAQSLGVSVGEVYSMTDEDTPYYFQFSYSASVQEDSFGGATDDPSIAKGLIRISASVEVKFFLEGSGVGQT